ncbi:DUF4347 domain-containing protein [Okeania sp. SIO2B3]|uniref:DUF4347 domain-containing protein n=1 Tax=Okeania sp. SIO2B3 TaxID=2607784 RepID=UPI0013C1685C|nr:DUF4347 domain-containing protein [Okeania sp. SIO2B3]NET45747.1 DUF4347 domain-containing protein [Okeania sp. SIO2B3]
MNKIKLLFIDSKVENYHYLISQVDPQTKTVILQPNQNGIDQISKSLGKCLDVETIHIISHGETGTLYLGNSILNLDNVRLYVESIQQWGKCLSAGGEILIYGCQVASGNEGKEFVRQLHQLTGANIAASETLTGNVSKGGNWNLEVIFGKLKSAFAFTPEVRASYAGVLADIVVNTTNDVVDDSDGVTSLREAIIEANSTPEDDTIQLTAGATYNLTIAGSEEDAAATGDLDLIAGGGEITVISQGEEQAVIDAGGETGIGDRVFHVLEDAALQLENVEITGGVINNFPGGGAIYISNSGIVNINNSTISSNSSTNSAGGISNFGMANINNSTISGNLSTYGAGGISNLGTLNVNNSTISGNYHSYSSILESGGVSNSGTANITNSTISGNSAVDGGGIKNGGTLNINNSRIIRNSAYYGGGVSNRGTLTINNSTISGNLVVSTELGYGGEGGGIRNYLGTANINNSTISGNSAFDGGGIRNERTISVSHSTISGNSAFAGGGIQNSDGTATISNSTITLNRASQGGGILHNHDSYYYYFPTTTVTSSIVSGNFISSVVSRYFNGDVDFTENNDNLISGDNNLIGTGSAIEIFNGDNDQTGVTDPLLEDLADNGGPTLTHLPLPNSPAVDAGSNPNALTTDQRGEPRFVGEGVDIGAVELQNSPQITGTPQSDRLNGTDENNTITGLTGNDTINGRGDDDQIIGSRGSDFLYGKDGDDTLEGRQDNDFLFGGNGNDSLVGGQGRDRFNGGTGDDTLTGGASIDRFIFNTTDEFNSDDIGVDDITDFVPGQDVIFLDKSTFTAITSDSGTGFSVDAEFAIVTSDADAETSEAVIVYNSNNGKLFYNANGTEAEFGSGGEFVNLTNTASISEDDFFLRG